jgi:hypothetical protein
LSDHDHDLPLISSCRITHSAAACLAAASTTPLASAAGVAEPTVASALAAAAGPATVVVDAVAGVATTLAGGAGDAVNGVARVAAAGGVALEETSASFSACSRRCKARPSGAPGRSNGYVETLLFSLY